METNRHTPVPRPLFLEELRLEWGDLAQAGTSYRAETARLAYWLAQQVPCATLFSTLDDSRALSLGFLSVQCGEERVEDVAHFLFHVHGSLSRAINYSAIVQAQLERRRCNRQR